MVVSLPMTEVLWLFPLNRYPKEKGNNTLKQNKSQLSNKQTNKQTNKQCEQHKFAGI